jgi:hypothetical protein
MSRRAYLQRIAGVEPSLGHVGNNMPKWLHRLAGFGGKLIHRYEEIALRKAEKEIVTYCKQAVLLSPAETDELRQYVEPSHRTKIIHIPPMQTVHRLAQKLKQPLRLIFVGGENLPQNRLTLLRLFDLWSRAKPSTELHWFGKRNQNGISPPNGVVCHGFVDDLTTSAYDSRSVLLNPAVLAGGVKTKMLEAIAYGCPAVGNAAAFEGLDWPNYPLILDNGSKTWERFICNPEEWRDALQEAIHIGQMYLDRLHHPNIVSRQWTKLL